MFVFLSYAREDTALAERIHATLAAAGFDCFLDTKSLPPGQEYNARIRQAVDRADLFIVLVSPQALDPGSYVSTELAFAERKWRNPSGYVLPVAATTFDGEALPAYLRPINVLPAQRNVEARVLAWVQERIEQGGGTSDDTPRDRLERWRRLNQPPLRRARKLMLRHLFSMIVAFAFIGFGVLASTVAAPAPDEMRLAMTVIPILVGGGVALYAVVQSVQALVGAAPVAALVLDRSDHKGVTVHLLLANGARKRYTAVGHSANSAYPGEIGWAFIAGGLLLDFERGPRMPTPRY